MFIVQLNFPWNPWTLFSPLFLHQISRIIHESNEMFCICITLHIVEKEEILSHQKNISSNQLFSNLFSKTVTFMKFLPKMREREFDSRNFHTVHCGHVPHHFFAKFSCNQRMYLVLDCTECYSHEFFINWRYVKIL